MAEMCSPLAFNEDFQVIQYAPKSDVNENWRKCEVVPHSESEIAEPTRDFEDMNCEHWADVVVTAESDEENKGNKKSPKQEYLCYLCNYRSDTDELLVRHMMRKHTFLEEQCFVCGVCEHKYPSEELMMIHLKEHVPKKQVIDDSWKRKIVKYDIKKKYKWTKEQRAILAKAYKTDKYLNHETRIRLAKELQVDPKKITIWFSGRRKYLRRKRTPLVNL